MGLDAKVKSAVVEAAKNLDQAENLTKQLVAWLDGLVSGNESLDDRQSVHRHLELLFDAVKTDTNET